MSHDPGDEDDFEQKVQERVDFITRHMREALAQSFGVDNVRQSDNFVSWTLTIPVKYVTCTFVLVPTAFTEGHDPGDEDPLWVLE